MVDFTICAWLVYAIRGGSVPRLRTDQPTDIDYFLNKLRDKHPEKRHRRIEAHNISKLCEKYPGKYPAPSEFYFGDIDAIFSASKDAEIDVTVLRVENESHKRTSIRNRRNASHRNRSSHRSIRVRWCADLTMRMRGRAAPV